MAVQQGRLVLQRTRRPGCGQDQHLNLSPSLGLRAAHLFSDERGGPGAGGSLNCPTPGAGSVPRVQGWELLRGRGPAWGDCLVARAVPCCPWSLLVFLVVCDLVFKDHWEQFSLGEMSRFSTEKKKKV